MFKLYFTPFFILLLLLLHGCASSKKVVVSPIKELPSWYQMPPLSNEDDLYALGDGKDKKEALANALNNMVSTLSVSISSTYNAKTVVKEGRVNSSEGIYVSNIESDVKKIRISHYELLHAQSLGFKKYAVLIKSNKQRLFESMLQEIRQNFVIIQEKEKTLLHANVLQKLSFYKNTKASLENLPNTLIVMSVLNPSFQSSKYLHLLETMDSKYQNILESISFFIYSDENTVNLQTAIAKGLSAKNFKIESVNTQTHFRVYLTSTIERADSYGFTLARSDINIVTKDYNGVIVGSNTFNLIGQSSQGYSIAKQNLIYKLNVLIKKEGIAKIMGLDI